MASILGTNNLGEVFFTYESEKEDWVMKWNYAKDLPEEPKQEIIELTLEDIASKFGVDVNNIKIKK